MEITSGITRQVLLHFQNPTLRCTCSNGPEAVLTPCINIHFYYRNMLLRDQMLRSNHVTCMFTLHHHVSSLFGCCPHCDRMSVGGPSRCLSPSLFPELRTLIIHSIDNEYVSCLGCHCLRSTNRSPHSHRVSRAGKMRRGKSWAKFTK